MRRALSGSPECLSCCEDGRICRCPGSKLNGVRMPNRSIIVKMGLLSALCAADAFAAPTTRPTVEETSLGTVSGYDTPRNIAMDLDANHVAFIGNKGTQQVVVLDGKSGPAFDKVMSESLEFSPK